MKERAKKKYKAGIATWLEGERAETCNCPTTISRSGFMGADRKHNKSRVGKGNIKC